MTPPTLHDVYAARERVAPHVPRIAAAAASAARRSDRPVDLGEARESQSDLRLQGARRPEPGRRDDARRARRAASSPPAPAITASRSRLASRIHGVPCTVFVPDGNNPDKNAAMRAYGATVEEGGKDFDEARERCEARARQTGARYVHSADEPLLIAGVGTYALGSLRGAAERRRDLRADRRRLRRLRLDHRPQRARLAARRSSASAP